MQASVIHFDRFELDLNSYELRESGRLVKLERLPTELLILLTESQGQLVTRDAIVQRLWGDNVFVDTRQGINTAVRKIRVALHDDPEHPRLLETVAGKGYRLLAPVSNPSIARGRELEISPPLPTPIAGPAEAPAAAATRSPFSQRQLFLSVIALGALAAGVLWFFARRQGTILPATEQRVTSNPPDAPIKSAVVSPDGKYVAYADPTGLYLRDIASGETRPWGVPKDFIAYPNSWFPDGTHLLVTRMQGASRTPSLWKLSVLGGSPRMLIENAAAGAVSPDGSRIAYLPVPEFGKELWLMDSDGANPRKIAARESPNGPLWGSRIWPVVWSPGGQRIAYIEGHGRPAPDPAEYSFSLQTRDASGGDLQVVMNDTRLKPALCWVADGRILYAYREDPASERSDQGVRAIQVDQHTGKTISQPQIVTHGQGEIGGLSATTDGKRLLLWRRDTQIQAFIAEFEAGSRRLKTPRRLTLDANGNDATAWTPDSKAVLFVSNRNGTWKLFRQAIDQTTAEVLVEGRRLYLPRLSADGSQALYLAYPKPENPSSPVAVMRVPLAGGPPQLVLETPYIMNFQCASFPSRLCILSKQVGVNAIFFSFDTEHGMGDELTRTDSVTNWSLSPDGSELAIFLDNHRVRFLSLNTGLTHDVSVKDWHLENGDWSADGKSVFMQSVTSRGTPVILDVDQAGTAEVILEGDANIIFDWLIPSPDGRHGILGADIPGDNNVWMVQNF